MLVEVPFVCWFTLTLLVSLAQVARAGRFGTKGLSITFVSDESDATTLNSVQDRFEVNITELPDELDVTTYSEWLGVLASVCSSYQTTYSVNL